MTQLLKSRTTSHLCLRHHQEIMTCSHLTGLIIRIGHITLTDLITQAIQLRNGIKSEVDHTMVFIHFMANLFL